MGGILVTHPARQHSHQLARALFDRGNLHGYWTGVPAAEPNTKGPLYKLLARLSPQPAVGLPARVVRHNYLVPLTWRLAGAMLSSPRAVALRHWADARFDDWAAQRLPGDIQAVVCYENAALDTFRVARERGITTILDAASFHYAWQDDFYEPVEGDDVHEAINERKKEEIQHADHILTVSELARESYLDAGVAPSRVTSVPMGADLSDFVPADNPSAADGPFTFLFAGHAGRRKGADLLLEASENLADTSELDHLLQFAGGYDDGLFQQTTAPVETLGFLDHSALAEAFRRADCLVLPSRHDSFGRVVVEAMATGLPVLVSEHVGAKELVREGETGWVVPAEDITALTEQMRWCLEHREQLRQMSTAAAETARQYSWEEYHERVSMVLKNVVNSRSLKVKK
ncbi:glycosyltransferase family 4 protein [Salinibacter ruber]|uniref:glycosyltransferase family 4 protein n=1 Tax=Salinibacter ruber TaxID=146919 RepID=UPI00216A132E|nr:glycosyltransferase family 4 protein [Salinibacter ruber]